jgi:DNA-binding phage protein
VQQLAATTGLAEEELRRAFAGDCVLDLAKILKLLHALGIKLSASVTNDTSVAA